MRPLGGLGAVSLLVVALAGCGKDGVPDDAVAVVGEHTVKRSTFDRWLRITAISARVGGAADASVVVPDPPDFGGCVAARRASPPVRGERADAAELKARCEREYASLRDQTMRFLLNAARTEAEAEEAGVELSDAELEKRLASVRRQSFAEEADFRRFLASSGMTSLDFRFRARIDTLSEKLRERALKSQKGSDQPVSAAQIRDYYAANKRRFAQPEARELRVVLTRDRGRALRARTALQRGGGWAAVTREFSVDATAKARGGARLTVIKGQSDGALDRAAFAARKGEIGGPIRADAGFYVFAVQRIRPASQRTLRQATPLIRQLLRSGAQQSVIDGYLNRIAVKWKQRTECREGFATQDCRNAPKVATVTAPRPSPGAQRTTP